ncbi:MAG: hypothetical protein R6U98_29505 [Pirellulaceae bacterium]
MERCPTQAVLPLVGLAAEKVIGERYKLGIGRAASRRTRCQKLTVVSRPRRVPILRVRIRLQNARTVRVSYSARLIDYASCNQIVQLCLRKPRQPPRMEEGEGWKTPLADDHDGRRKKSSSRLAVSRRTNRRSESSGRDCRDMIPYLKEASPG